MTAKTYESLKDAPPGDYTDRYGRIWCRQAEGRGALLWSFPCYLVIEADARISGSVGVLFGPFKPLSEEQYRQINEDGVSRFRGDDFEDFPPFPGEGGTK